MIATVCGILTKTCSLLLPSYFNVWEAPPGTLLQTSVDKKRGSSLSPQFPGWGYGLPQDTETVSHVAKDVFQLGIAKEDCGFFPSLSPY